MPLLLNGVDVCCEEEEDAAVTTTGGRVRTTCRRAADARRRAGSRSALQDCGAQLLRVPNAHDTPQQQQQQQQHQHQRQHQHQPTERRPAPKGTRPAASTTNPPHQPLPTPLFRKRIDAPAAAAARGARGPRPRGGGRAAAATARRNPASADAVPGRPRCVVERTACKRKKKPHSFFSERARRSREPAPGVVSSAMQTPSIITPLVARPLRGRAESRARHQVARGATLRPRALAPPPPPLLQLTSPSALPPNNNDNQNTGGDDILECPTLRDKLTPR
jgi:hypothetical protein